MIPMMWIVWVPDGSFVDRIGEEGISVRITSSFLADEEVTVIGMIRSDQRFGCEVLWSRTRMAELDIVSSSRNTARQSKGGPSALKVVGGELV